MDKLLSKYTIISLGYNCFIKKYMNYKNISQETQLFDYIGSPMWGINKFIIDINNNNSEYLFKKDDYELLNITNKEKMVTQKKYYFRFLHDLNDIPKKNYTIKLITNKYSKNIQKITNKNKDELFDKFKEKYKRRIQRFTDILSSNKILLFIRFEEKMEDRILYDFINDAYKIDELDYLIEFSNIIKNINPLLEFKIIYITKKFQNSFNGNIVILNISENITNYNNCEIKFDELFEKNINFFAKYL